VSFIARPFRVMFLLCLSSFRVMFRTFRPFRVVFCAFRVMFRAFRVMLLAQNGPHRRTIAAFNFKGQGNKFVVAI
jgi:hypothetical protein